MQTRAHAIARVSGHGIGYKLFLLKTFREGIPSAVATFQGTIKICKIYGLQKMKFIKGDLLFSNHYIGWIFEDNLPFNFLW